jgi:hypothetical protein
LLNTLQTLTVDSKVSHITPDLREKMWTAIRLGFVPLVPISNYDLIKQLFTFGIQIVGLVLACLQTLTEDVMHYTTEADVDVGESVEVV